MKCAICGGELPDNYIVSFESGNCHIDCYEGKYKIEGYTKRYLELQESKNKCPNSVKEANKD